MARQNARTESENKSRVEPSRRASLARERHRDDVPRAPRPPAPPAPGQTFRRRERATRRRERGARKRDRHDALVGDVSPRVVALRDDAVAVRVRELETRARGRRGGGARTGAGSNAFERDGDVPERDVASSATGRWIRSIRRDASQDGDGAHGGCVFDVGEEFFVRVFRRARGGGRTRATKTSDRRASSR